MKDTFMLYFEYPDGTPAKNSCQVAHQSWVGDGWCDASGGYNTPECEFDGGDCCTYSCDKSSKYKCERGSKTSCVVDLPFKNEGDYTTGWRSMSADWGGSGYVSTTEDIAKFIKAWYKTPEKLFGSIQSRCRMVSDEMSYWNDDWGYGYGMGFE